MNRGSVRPIQNKKVGKSPEDILSDIIPMLIDGKLSSAKILEQFPESLIWYNAHVAAQKNKLRQEKTRATKEKKIAQEKLIAVSKLTPEEQEAFRLKPDGNLNSTSEHNNPWRRPFNNKYGYFY